MINNIALKRFAKSGEHELDGKVINAKTEFLSSVRKATSALLSVDRYRNHLYPETMEDAEYSKDDLEKERRALVKQIEHAANKVLWLNMICNRTVGEPFITEKVEPREGRLNLLYQFNLSVGELAAIID